MKRRGAKPDRTHYFLNQKDSFDYDTEKGKYAKRKKTT